MLLKSPHLATVLVTALVTVSCRSAVPWAGERVDEVNVGFTLENNLVMLHPNVRIDNRAGRFLLGTAARQTVVDSGFPLPGRNHLLQLGEKESLPISPGRMDLGGVADMIVGADAWRDRAISIDYRSGLVTYQKQGIQRSQMRTYEFRAEPAINVTVDGRTFAAVVDTSNPDTLVLPGVSGRGTVSVTIAGTNFGPTDVRYAAVTHPRVGNRLLSRFLVSIDYGRRVVGLWRDPRIPL
jgi:hypothetical protein